MEDIKVIISVQKAIEDFLCMEKNKKMIIYPFGEMGRVVKRILNDCYGYAEDLIIDAHYSKFNDNIKSIEYLDRIAREDYAVLFTYSGEDDELYDLICKYFPTNKIYRCIANSEKVKKNTNTETVCGKYSYGPLCNHPYVESVGAFCSFAYGTDVVGNHATQYISTHDFLTLGCDPMFPERKYEDFRGAKYFMEGILPRGEISKRKKVKIGNDVWLGAHVIITNGSDIGNGVIAGAGAVITKPVPDYAIVGGVPARIIKYRYTDEQIAALNKIQWWNWSDDKIREYYSDFYDDIDIFINKHLKESMG